MGNSGIHSADARRSDLEASPINADWVIDGAPVARSVQLTASEDESVSTYLWDCTAGRFHWHFGVDEIVHILEGEVHVTCDDGRTIVLQTGDVGHFPLHSHAIWHVPEYVRKLAVHRAPQPRPLAVRAVSRLRRLATSGSAALALPVLEALPV
jgi:uncharacterized cupin superfamily protein